MTHPVTGLVDGTYYTFQIKANEPAGNLADGPSIIVQTVRTSPPTPTGPPVGSAGVTTPSKALSHLYTGTNPVQTDVDPIDIDPKRMSLVRGHVKFASNDADAPNVLITVADHPELGQTMTQADGTFSIVVNGGHSVVLNYSLNGTPDYLPVQRRVTVGWGEYVWAPDVAMTEVPASSGTWTQNDPFKSFDGGTVTDYSGTRTARLMIPAGTTAELELDDGTLVGAPSLDIRIAEYTIGANGPAAMPAGIPDGVGYTYAVEITALESINSDARHIWFSQPVSVVVDNFIGAAANARFPTGAVVPVGYYDRVDHEWVSAPSGSVIEIVGYNATTGEAELDTTGDGQPDNSGIPLVERAEIAVKYPSSIGKTLWRFTTDHLTTWDCNWALWPPNGTLPPDFFPEDFIKRDNEDDCKRKGSIIECDNQSLGEAIDLAGTGLSLNYQSLRMEGRATNRHLTIPLVGDTVPPNCGAVVAEVQIAGKRWEFPAQPCTPNTSTSMVWDGYDFQGRRLQGSQKAKVRIGYRYNGVDYATTDNFGGLGAGSANVVADRASGTFTLYSEYEVLVGGIYIGPENSIGGWTLDAHHRYDPLDGVIHFGDGTRRFAGTFVSKHVTTSPKLSNTGRIAYAADGTLYIAGAYGISKRTISGATSDVTGSGPTTDCYGDGQPASGIDVGGPARLRISDRGEILFLVNGRIRGIDTAGKLSTRVSSITAPNGPGCEGVELDASSILDFDVAPEGRLVVLVKEVLGSTGVRTVNRSTFSDELCADQDPLCTSPLAACNRILYDRNATNGGFPPVPMPAVFLRCNGEILSVQLADVAIDTIVTGISSAGAMTLGLDGRLYFVDGVGQRQIRTKGKTLFAGEEYTGNPESSGDDGHPLLARYAQISDLAVHPDGAIAVMDYDRVRIVRARTQKGQGFSFPTADGAGIHVFDSEYRHIKTIDAVGGAALVTFGYDTEGRLESVTDHHGNVVTIQRDMSGMPQTITAPFNRVTTVGADSSGYLSFVRNMEMEQVTLLHRPDGLLTDLTDPKGYLHKYTWDEVGRLESDDLPVAQMGKQTLSRAGDNDNYSVSLTTQMGRATTYAYSRLDPAEASECPFDASVCKKQVVTLPDGVTTTTYVIPDGSKQVHMPDGTIASARAGSDPRWGNDAPLTKSVTLMRPNGTVISSVGYSRTVQLNDPADLTSLVYQRDETTVGNRTTTAEYTVNNGADDAVVTTSPEGRQTTRLVNAKGQTTKLCVGGASCDPVIAPGIIVTEYTYDAQGRLKTVVTGERHVEYFYSVVTGFLDYTQTYAGMVGGAPKYLTTSSVADAIGRVKELHYPDGKILEFGHDANGNVDSVVPPDRPSHAFAFKALDLTHKYTPPLLPDGYPRERSYEHNDDAQTIKTVLPDYSDVSVDFESSTGRVSTISFNGVDPASGTVTWGSISYAYEGQPNTGRVESATRVDPIANSTLSFVYDAGVVSSTTWAGAVSATVSYNRDSYQTNQQVTETADGDPLVYTFDKDGLLLSVGSLTVVSDPQFGRTESRSVACVNDTYAYNEYGERTSYSASCSSGPGDLYAYSLEYNELGQVKTKTETVGGVNVVRKYRYDDRGRLEQIDDLNDLPLATYTYDGNGNRLSAPDAGAATIELDDHDQLKKYGVYTALTYTLNGEVGSIGGPAGTTTYHHDSVGVLRRVVLPDAVEIEYALDPSNRLIAKVRDGVTVRRWVYDESNRPILEWDESGQKTRFVYGANGSVPDYMVKAGTMYALLTDHVGSPRFIVDSSNGTVVQQIDYDEFGRVLADSNPGFQPFGFAGGFYDEDTGLVRFGPRSYDARFGRWTSRDPSGFPDGGNRYSYANNDPVNRIDPSGLAWQDVAERWGNRAAGWADYASFGIGPWLRGKLGLNGWIDECSAEYRQGMYAGMILDALGLFRFTLGLARWGARNLASRAGKACFNSFAEGTSVATPDGDVPIESLEVGDLVLARSDTTGEVSWKPIEKVLHSNEKKPTVELTLRHPISGTETLRVTENHPLWVVGQGWVDAGEVRLGDELYSADGSYVTIIGSATGLLNNPVYNFEIAGDHTYFAGNASVWAHNSCDVVARMSTSLSTAGCLYKCVEHAAALQQRMARAGLGGVHIRLEPASHIWVVSKSHGALVTAKGLPHEAIAHGTMVFDNMTSAGAHYIHWLEDLYGAEAWVGRIKTTPF